MNHPTFLEWNCRGFKVNFNELSLLIQKHCPVALCLQETHLKETNKINIKNYVMYNYYAQTNRASGGSSIAINNSSSSCNSSFSSQNNYSLLCLYPSKL